MLLAGHPPHLSGPSRQFLRHTRTWRIAIIALNALVKILLNSRNLSQPMSCYSWGCSCVSCPHRNRLQTPSSWPEENWRLLVGAGRSPPYKESRYKCKTLVWGSCTCADKVNLLCSPIVLDPAPGDQLCHGEALGEAEVVGDAAGQLCVLYQLDGLLPRLTPALPLPGGLPRAAGLLRPFLLDSSFLLAGHAAGGALCMCALALSILVHKGGWHLEDDCPKGRGR